MKVTKEEMEKYASDMLARMDEIFKSTKEFQENFEKNKESISPESISFCLEKFLHAEFDYGAPGNRGIGRATDFCPRLAAYFRKAFSKLSVEEMRNLDTQITTLIIKSYLFGIFFSRDSVKKSKHSKEKLFEIWIPQIYIFNLGGMQEGMADVLFALIQKDYEGIKKSFTEYGMKPGFFGGDKTQEILNGYVAAGLVMRLAEKS